MAKYVFLINWTEQGVRDVKDTTRRGKQAQEFASKAGGSLEILWTIGRYDVIGFGDFPDDETASVFALQVSGQGAIRTETLRAFTADEVSGMLAKLG